LDAGSNLTLHYNTDKDTCARQSCLGPAGPLQYAYGNVKQRKICFVVYSCRAAMLS
jgi:hypothetical protein